MNEKLRQRLIEVARRGRKTTYGEIKEVAGVDRADSQLLFTMLGEISTFEHENGRPLLSVVVVRRDTRLPGVGFFYLAGALGRVDIEGDTTEAEFFAEELGRVHAYWAHRS